MLRDSTKEAGAPQLVWRNAGEPGHKYTEESYNGPCATCAATCGVGVSTNHVNNPTFSNHAEFFKFGTHVCRACAWLYGDPKRAHRNVLAAGDELWWPMISVESATEERPSWLELFRRLEDMDSELPLCGVLTTDPKPRNWPRMQLSTAGAPGLYIHSPDYDIAEFRTLDTKTLLAISSVVRSALLMGFSKLDCNHGLTRNYKRFVKNYGEAKDVEDALKQCRSAPEFVPALLITQITKEEKSEARGITQGLEPGGTTRREANEDDHRLF